MESVAAAVGVVGVLRVAGDAAALASSADRAALDVRPARLRPAEPSLPMSGETLTIEDSMTLRARMENAGHVGDEQEWSWSSG